MSYQIYVGLFTEGTTDDRFLQNIVQRTMEEVAFDAHGQIEIEVCVIKIDKTGLDFKAQVTAASKKGVEDFGMSLFCVHRDADNSSAAETLKNIIEPAIATLAELNDEEYCKKLIPIIPIQETEAWMLADSDLLKTQIGATQNDSELGFHRAPESVASPKEVIENAIRIVQQYQQTSKRRRKGLRIGDLYLSISQLIDLQVLRRLNAYQEFELTVRQAFRELNLLA